MEITLHEDANTVIPERGELRTGVTVERESRTVRKAIPTDGHKHGLTDRQIDRQAGELLKSSVAICRERL